MNKTNIINLLNECFESEGNCCYLHLTDGNELLVMEEPKFFDNVLSANQKSVINSNEVHEVVFVPYTSIIYITLTNEENLKLVAEQYMEQYEPLNEVTLDDFNDDE